MQQVRQRTLQANRSIGQSIRHTGIGIMSIVAVGVLLGACGGASSASNVMEANNISLRATIDYWEAAAPTMTAQAVTLTAQNQNLQLQLDQAERQVRDLTTRLNGGSGQPVIQAGAPATQFAPAQSPQISANTGGNTAPNIAAANDSNATSNAVAGVPTVAAVAPANSASGTGAQTAPDGMTLEQIVLAGAVDSRNCPQNEVASFNTQANRVYAVAIVGKFKQGTQFVTTWRGTNMEAQVFDWTANYASAASECVYFYIEPATLGMTAGEYSMTYSITGLQDVTIPFTLQGDAAQSSVVDTEATAVQ